MFPADVPLMLPEYYRADFGQRIEGMGSEAGSGGARRRGRSRPQRPVAARASPAASLSAARNDHEAVQIVVRPQQALKQLTAAAGALSGPGGATIPAENMQVLRVYYHRVRTPDRRDERAGRWPDALPPLNKPIDLPAGKNQPLWVLVHVPKDAPAGRLRGRGCA